jgi:hypothetical protein
MIDLLFTTLQLLLKGKLFRDAVQVYTRLALCNVAAAAVVIVSTAFAWPWLLLLLVAVLGLLVPFSLRHVKYR